MSYPIDLLRRSRRLFFALARVMLPVMIAVEVGQRLGWVDSLGRAIAPAMGWIGLPSEAGLIWITGVFVGVYGAIGALIGLAPGLEMSAGQFSALCSMILFAHAIPVEQAIVRRAGGSFLVTAALRIGVALAYGAAVAWTCRLTGLLAGPVALDWLSGSTLAGETRGVGFLGWIEATAFSLAVTFAIIVGLLVLLDVLERTGITRRITAALAPLLRVSGLDASAAPVTTVGVLLGLTYGGALIIEEAQRQRFSARTRFLALAWLSLSHALIEDTVLLVALGANVWVVLVGRVLVTLAAIAVLARVLNGGDGAAARLPAGAG
ncbi:MAG TPA: nucleoside recognition domain-containing protein [Zeimonas sp.]|nr:nucleoside recognition domain-containing protein [Zeimonas sp.]